MALQDIIKEIRVKGYIQREKAGSWGVILYKKNPGYLRKAVIKAANNRKYDVYITPNFLGEIVQVLN